MTMVSPDRPCIKCGCIFSDIKPNGRVCLDCNHFTEERSLEEECPGITAKIINARIEEERGEEE